MIGTVQKLTMPTFDNRTEDVFHNFRLQANNYMVVVFITAPYSYIQ